MSVLMFIYLCGLIVFGIGFYQQRDPWDPMWHSALATFLWPVIIGVGLIMKLFRVKGW